MVRHADVCSVSKLHMQVVADDDLVAQEHCYLVQELMANDLHRALDDGHLADVLRWHKQCAPWLQSLRLHDSALQETSPHWTPSVSIDNTPIAASVPRARTSAANCLHVDGQTCIAP